VCPKCRADLRTGERPEEYVPLWRRKKAKFISILVLLSLPLLIYSFLTSESDQGLYGWARARLGTCAEPREKWEEFSQEEFEKGVKGGYNSWSSSDNKRVTGQSAKGPDTPERAARPESEKIIERDNQTYFATSLMSEGPSKSLKPQDNWYMLMSGEWDVAWIIDAGTAQEKVVAGEWTFTWINNGQAVQDVLSVPYQWSKPPEGLTPIQITTVRMFNPKNGTWEGFHVMDGAMVYFAVSKTKTNQVMERYQLAGEPLVVWLYEEVKPDSFKVSVSHATEQGAWVKVADLWCKRRRTVIP
jgi:hypothetical protein